MARAAAESKPTTDEAADALEAEDVAEGIATSEHVATSKMKAYVSDRNLAEVNAGVTVWLDPASEVGTRLLATDYFTEVEDPA